MYGSTLRACARAALPMLVVGVAFVPGTASATIVGGNLPGGTSIEVTIASPADGAVLPEGPVALSGVAAVGEAAPVARTALITVVDTSGSTSRSGGCGDHQNADGVANTILDCEIAAARALNTLANNGTVGDTGAIAFAERAQIGDVEPATGQQNFTTPVADANGNSENDMGEVLMSAREGNLSSGVSGFSEFTPQNLGLNTNFAAAVSNVASLAAGTALPKVIVAFLSDGEATVGGSISGPLSTVPAKVDIHTFAVGSSASCAITGVNGEGSLQQIANATGGTCTNVTDVASLPAILPGVIASQLTDLSLTVDGTSAETLTGSPTLPVAGSATSSFSTSVAGLAPGTHELCVIATGSDAGGTGSVTDCHSVTINARPSTDAAGDVSGDEGSAIALTGAVIDPDGPSTTAAWSFTPGAGTDAGAACSFADPTAAVTSITCTDDGQYTATLTADDGVNASVSDTTLVTVANVAPAVSISAPTDGALFALGSSIAVTAPFTDTGSNDTHTCTVDFDDGTGPAAALVTEAAGSGSCTASRAPSSAGVYTIVATVTDDDGAASSASILAVVYDPSAGFVTGGGHIESPAGAYPADPGLTGPANFGFVSKYKRGATTPTGQTEFQFKLAGLNFHSTEYQWLVVSGPKAQYKGTGTINGVPGYSFLLTATDGQSPGGGGVDKFRMKIVDTGSGTVVYDNAIGSSDDIDSANPQALTGGQIVIHK